MTEPTEKDPVLAELMNLLFDRENKIKANKCVLCGKDATEFVDDFSRREFAISGLCQECQDEVFK